MNHDVGRQPAEMHPSGADGAKAAVERWLAEKGLALELSTARAFRAAAHRVEHARSYVTDDGTGRLKVREIDVLAWCSSDSNTGTVPVGTWFVIECKSSTKSPWVLYQGTTRPPFVAQDPRQLIRAAFSVALRGANVSDLDETRLWESRASVCEQDAYAYQVTDIGQNGKSNDPPGAFEAVQQVLSAVDAVTAELNSSAGPAELSILVPVVVTAAPLFAVRIGDRGAVSIERREWAPLIARLRPSEELRLVWIVQADAVKDYAATAVEGARRLRTTLHAEG